MKRRMPGRLVWVKQNHQIILASWRPGKPGWVWSGAQPLPCSLPLHHCPALHPQPSSGPWDSPLGLPSSPAPASAAMATGTRVTKEVAGSCFLLVLTRKLSRLQRLHCSAPPGCFLCSRSGWAQTPSSANRTMCTSLTTCEWKKVFYEKMEVAKPADSWELIIDPNLKPNELAPGWKQYLEQHASGR